MIEYNYYLNHIDLVNPKTVYDFLSILTGKDKKVLEIGTTTTNITKILRQRGCSVTRIEKISEQTNHTQPSGDKIIVEDLETLDIERKLRNAKFDVILLGEALEQLKDPTHTLKRIRPFLFENGYIVCSIYNIAHGSIRLKLLNGDFDYKETGILAKSHLRFFTLESINHLLKIAGYQIQDLRRVKADIFDCDGIELKPFTIPTELINSILRDPESTTFQYVLSATPNNDGNHKILDWNYKFTHNLPQDSLKNYIDALHKTIEQKNSEISNLKKILEGNQKL